MNTAEVGAGTGKLGPRGLNPGIGCDSAGTVLVTGGPATAGIAGTGVTTGAARGAGAAREAGAAGRAGAGAAGAAGVAGAGTGGPVDAEVIETTGAAGRV